jgi:hypothetical protein
MLMIPQLCIVETLSAVQPVLGPYPTEEWAISSRWSEQCNTHNDNSVSALDLQTRRTKSPASSRIASEMTDNMSIGISAISVGGGIVKVGFLGRVR